LKMLEMEIMCPAKVNLFFELHGKRDDGYHEVETFMQAAGLYDRLVFKKKPSGVRVLCDDPSVPSGSENIVFRTISLLAEKTNFPAGVDVEITKNIPAGSGLGGGSSDAAGTLAALNLLYSLGLGRKDLQLIGREIGADVPFFAGLLTDDMTSFSGGAATGRGRGDEIEALPGIAPWWLVIVSPGFSLSTAQVYGELSLNLTEKRSDITMMLEHAGKKDICGVSSCLFNRLEFSVIRKNPLLGQLKQELLRAGASGALMTGSGSAVFGLAPDRKTACAIKEKMVAQRKGVNVYAAAAL
jgi:4-diphosphocytidyl-2-C-methyl-D-erythritol kinase